MASATFLSAPHGVVAQLRKTVAYIASVDSPLAEEANRLMAVVETGSPAASHKAARMLRQMEDQVWSAECAQARADHESSWAKAKAMTYGLWWAQETDDWSQVVAYGWDSEEHAKTTLVLMPYEEYERLLRTKGECPYVLFD